VNAGKSLNCHEGSIKDDAGESAEEESCRKTTCSS
jgi:hypothetical protein